MFRFLLPILLCINSLSFANYIKYYEHVNKGEYHMYEGQYLLAVTELQLAFGMVEEPFARDYYLASKCYAQLSQETPMLNYLNLAMKGGLDKDFIKGDSLWFANYWFTTHFKDVLNLKTEKEVALNLDQKSAEALRKIDIAFDKSKIMDYYNAYRHRDSLPAQYKIALKKYRPYRDSIAKMLTDYYCNYTFPKDIKNKALLSKFSIVILDNSIPKIDSVIQILVRNTDLGILHPLEAADILDFLRQDGLNPQVEFQSDYGLYENSVLQKNYNGVIANRRAIGLSTYYFDAPNYKKNYKPTPLDKILFEVDFEIIGYD